MRKFDLSKKLSLESQSGAAPVEQETLEVLEPVVVQDPHEAESEELSSGIDELTETTAALESLMFSLEASMSKGGMTASELSLVKMHSDYLTKRIGLESVVVSNENATTRIAQTQLALESIGDKIKEAGKAIVEFLRKIYNTVLASLAKLKSSVVDTAEKIANGIDNLLPEMFNKTITARIDYFDVNGVMTRDLLAAVSKSNANIKSFNDARFLGEYKKLQEKANAVLEKGEPAKPIIEELRELNKTVYATLNKFLRFDSGTNPDYLPKDHLAGRTPVGLLFHSDEHNPAIIFSLISSHPSHSFEKISLSKLGVSKESGKALLSISSGLKYNIDHLEDVITEAQKLTETAVDYASRSNASDNAREYLKVTNAVQKSSATILRVGYGLCVSVATAILELNNAIDAASKKD